MAMRPTESTARTLTTRTDVANGREPRPVFWAFRESSDITGAQVGIGSVEELRKSFEYHPSPILPEGFGDGLVGDANDGCDCIESCEEDCQCIEEHGCFYDEQGLLLLEALPLRHALHECSSLCRCNAEACRNRVSQRGVRVQVRVSPTSKGFGLFSADTISRGTFVCLYAGETISSAEAKQRWEARKRRGEGNYVLVMREAIGSEAILKTIVDPTHRGNVGRFINHACPPKANVIILPIRPIGHVVPVAAMFAACHIKADEELSFDYADAGGEVWLFGRGSDLTLTQDDSEAGKEGRTRCLCGSEACRGWMPFDVSL